MRVIFCMVVNVAGVTSWFLWKLLAHIWNIFTGRECHPHHEEDSEPEDSPRVLLECRSTPLSSTSRSTHRPASADQPPCVGKESTTTPARRHTYQGHGHLHWGVPQGAVRPPPQCSSQPFLMKMNTDPDWCSSGISVLAWFRPLQETCTGITGFCRQSPSYCRSSLSWSLTMRRT